MTEDRGPIEVTGTIMTEDIGPIEVTDTIMEGRGINNAGIVTEVVICAD